MQASMMVTHCVKTMSAISFDEILTRPEASNRLQFSLERHYLLDLFTELYCIQIY